MTIEDGMKFSVIFSVLAQLLMIVIYIYAMRKRYHVSFTILLIATCLSITYFFLATISYFIEMPTEQATSLYRFGLYLTFPNAILGVVGTWLLIRAFLESTPKAQPDKDSTTSGKWGP